MSMPESTDVPPAARLIAKLALSVIVGTGAALLIVVGSCSVCLAQQAASVGNTEETLAEKVTDPTANLTQITTQDLYAPAEYGTNAQPNTLQIRPILAVRPQLFTPLEQLIRPTFQVVTVPRGKGASTTTALADMQLLDLFVMPWPNSKETLFRWGSDHISCSLHRLRNSAGTARGRWDRRPLSLSGKFRD